LREHTVVPKPRNPRAIPLRDPADRYILASALAGKADVLVTGDRDLLDESSILGASGPWSASATRAHGEAGIAVQVNLEA